MKQKYLIIRLETGEYLRDYQYSQGHLTFTPCKYPWEAMNFNKMENQWVPNLDFARKCFPGATLVSGEVSFKEELDKNINL